MPMFYRVRDKIGMTEIPKDAQYLSASEIETTVCKWMTLFKSHRILLAFNEEEIDYKRRYLFIRNVFLDMQLPAHPPELYFCFLYEHYQHDAFLEAPEALVEELLQGILGAPEKIQAPPLHKRIKLNQFHNLSEPEFCYVLDKHQKKYHSISAISLKHEGKTIQGNRLILMGSHVTGIGHVDYCTINQGKWRVELLRTEGSWLVSGIYIEGIEF